MSTTALPAYDDAQETSESGPPVTPPSPGRHAAPSVPAETELQRALRIAEANRVTIGKSPTSQAPKGEGILGRLTMVEKILGTPADSVLELPATGMQKKLAEVESTLKDLVAAVKHLADSIAEDKSARERVQAARDKELELRSARVWQVLVALIIAALLGVGSMLWGAVKNLRYEPAPAHQLQGPTR